jgi:hypothetical protein
LKQHGIMDKLLAEQKKAEEEDNQIKQAKELKK